MSWEREAELLEGYVKRNEEEIVKVSEIKAKYKEEVGHKIESGQIYEVLARHGWKKVLPQGRYPKKADEEVIEAKKINLRVKELPCLKKAERWSK